MSQTSLILCISHHFWILAFLDIIAILDYGSPCLRLLICLVSCYVTLPGPHLLRLSLQQCRIFYNLYLCSVPLFVFIFKPEILEDNCGTTELNVPPKIEQSLCSTILAIKGFIFCWKIYLNLNIKTLNCVYKFVQAFSFYMGPWCCCHTDTGFII